MTAATAQAPSFADEAPEPLDVAEVPGIPMAHRRGPNGRELLVVFSPTGRFVLHRSSFACDLLFVADRTGFYYVTRAPEIAAAVISVIERGGYERTLLMGSSKGGFGALVVARAAGRMRPDMIFRTLTFSPQVRLYPGNPALYFPSYRRMRAQARRQFELAWTLRRFGDVAAIGDLPNVRSTIVCGSGNPTDMGEAGRLRGPNAAIRTLPVSAHSIMVYLRLRNRPAGEVRSRIDRIYAKARRRGQEEDRDLFASRPVDPEQMVREIVSPPEPLPGLEDLIEEAIAAAPRRLTARETVAAWARRAGRLASLAIAEFRGWPKVAGKRADLSRWRPSDEPVRRTES